MNRQLKIHSSGDCQKNTKINKDKDNITTQMYRQNTRNKAFKKQFHLEISIIVWSSVAIDNCSNINKLLKIFQLITYEIRPKRMPLLSFNSLLEHALIGGILSTLFIISNYSLHRIEEGHVGIYFRVSFSKLIKELKIIKFMNFLGRCSVAFDELSWLPHDDTIVNFIQKCSGTA